MTQHVARRVTPNTEIAMSLLYREGQALGVPQRSTVSDSIIWFIQTGRAFTGLERALAHMGASTIRAFVTAVQREMQAAATARGRTSLVTGDLTNAALALALGFADAHEASHACCEHPYGKSFVLR